MNAAMSAPIRVLLLEIPKLLRDILEQTIRHDDDYELIVDRRSATAMLAGQAVLPDAVILGLTAAEDATLVPTLLARWPTTQVVTVAQTGGDTLIYELRPSCRMMNNVTPAEILAVLRGSVRRKRTVARDSFTS